MEHAKRTADSSKAAATPPVPFRSLRGSPTKPGSWVTGRDLRGQVFHGDAFAFGRLWRARSIRRRNWGSCSSTWTGRLLPHTGLLVSSLSPYRSSHSRAWNLGTIPKTLGAAALVHPRDRRVTRRPCLTCLGPLPTHDNPGWTKPSLPATLVHPLVTPFTIRTQIPPGAARIDEGSSVTCRSSVPGGPGQAPSSCRSLLAVASRYGSTACEPRRMRGVRGSHTPPAQT